MGHCAFPSPACRLGSLCHHYRRSFVLERISLNHSGNLKSPKRFGRGNSNTRRSGHLAICGNKLDPLEPWLKRAAECVPPSPCKMRLPIPPFSPRPGLELPALGLETTAYKKERICHFILKPVSVFSR
jgi:hypothetical protein